jgi:Translationally controlled tumour protein
MKAIKEKLPADRVTDFEKGAQGYVKKIIANLKDYEFVGL